MSVITITDVRVLDNPSAFTKPFRFEISYQSNEALNEDMEWKLIYVGSAEDESYDQLLETVFVGPVEVGNFRFILQADAPDPSKIRDQEIVGLTVVLLTCSYMGEEFVRVGYYVNNEYDSVELRETPPPRVLVDRVQRNILSDKPRITKFNINFHPEKDGNGDQPPPPPPSHHPSAEPPHPPDNPYGGPES